MAVTNAAVRAGSRSMARVARRRISTMRSAVEVARGGRWATRCSSSVTHSTCAAASRWSLEVKYR